MGMMDNTLVVLASDKGGCPAYGGSNFPYRGFKHTLFEGGVRTPALVYSKSESIIPEKVSNSRELNELNGVAFIKTLVRKDWRARGSVLLHGCWVGMPLSNAGSLFTEPENGSSEFPRGVLPKPSVDLITKIKKIKKIKKAK